MARLTAALLPHREMVAQRVLLSRDASLSVPLALHSALDKSLPLCAGREMVTGGARL